MFLILDEKYFQLFSVEYDVSCGFVINDLYYVPLIPTLMRVFVMNEC